MDIKLLVSGEILRHTPSPLRGTPSLCEESHIYLPQRGPRLGESLQAIGHEQLGLSPLPEGEYPEGGRGWEPKLGEVARSDLQECVEILDKGKVSPLNWNLMKIASALGLLKILIFSPDTNNFLTATAPMTVWRN